MLKRLRLEVVITAFTGATAAILACSRTDLLSDGPVVFGAHTGGASGADATSMFIARYESDGTFSWAKSITGPATLAISSLRNGGVALAGGLTTRTVFGEGEANETTLPGPPSGYLAELTP